MNKNILKLKLLSASLCLGSTLLTGCNNEEVIGSSKINYENELSEGKIKYEDLNNYIKIVTIEYNGKSNDFLLIKEESFHIAYRGNPDYNCVEYIDLKTGTTLIKYYDYSEKEIAWLVGENLNIINEQDITGYLLESKYIKKEYEVNEILTFYEEEILPTLENSKEMIK